MHFLAVFSSPDSNEKCVRSGFWFSGCLQLGAASNWVESLLPLCAPTVLTGWGCGISKPFVFFLPYTFTYLRLHTKRCWGRGWDTVWEKQPVWNSTMAISTSSLVLSSKLWHPVSNLIII